MCTTPAPTMASDSNGQRKPCENRRSNKPIMEKRRRARINNCLNELKNLILDALKKDPARHSKLEKADILEMTVKHLETLQRQQVAMSVATDPGVVNKYRAGFSECATEVGRFLGRVDGLDTQVKQRLLSHLANCISGVNNTNTSQAVTPAQVLTAPVQVHFPTATISVIPQNSTSTSTTAVGADVPSNVFSGLQLVPTRLPNGDIAFVLPNLNRSATGAITVQQPVISSSSPGEIKVRPELSVAVSSSSLPSNDVKLASPATVTSILAFSSTEVKAKVEAASSTPLISSQPPPLYVKTESHSSQTPFLTFPSPPGAKYDSSLTSPTSLISPLRHAFTPEDSSDLCSSSSSSTLVTSSSNSNNGVLIESCNRKLATLAARTAVVAPVSVISVPIPPTAPEEEPFDEKSCGLDLRVNPTSRQVQPIECGHSGGRSAYASPDLKPTATVSPNMALVTSSEYDFVGSSSSKTSLNEPTDLSMWRPW